MSPTPAGTTSVVAAPSRRGLGTSLKILIGLAIAVLLFALFLAWGYWLFTQQARVAMSQNPMIQQHIGEIHSADFNWQGSAEAVEAEVFAFDLVGSLGRGTVTARFVTISPDEERITAGRLSMPDGNEYDLLPTAEE
jgi:hypothetical protein